MITYLINETEIPWNDKKNLPNNLGWMNVIVIRERCVGKFSDAMKFLDGEQILHHFEFLAPVMFLDRYGEWKRFGVMLHLYEENVAFQIRLRFNLLPMPKGWRKAFKSVETIIDPNAR